MKGAEMFEKVKESLRITHSKLDAEIQDIIDAAVHSLTAHGVNATGHEGDPLILNAVKLYAKWQMNYQDQADRYEKAWNAALVMLALCGDYNE